MKVIYPDPSDSEAVSQFMTEPVHAVVESFDDGMSYADASLEGMAADSHLHSHLVRYRAAQVLREQESNDGWRLGRGLQNSGIEVLKGPFTMRVFRAQDGGPPHPGGSFSRRQFWSQMDQLAFDLDGGTIGDAGATNLILDWAVDEYRRVVVALSKPAGVWDYQQRPRIEWRIPVQIGEERMQKFEATEEDVSIVRDLIEVANDGLDEAAET